MVEAKLRASLGSTVVAVYEDHTFGRFNFRLKKDEVIPLCCST